MPIGQRHREDPARIAQAGAEAGAGLPREPGVALGHSLELRNLHAYYGRQHAIKGISMRVAPNQVTGIIGPSGCGKSTLVRCINRMHEEIPRARTEGTVLLDTIDLYGSGVEVATVRRLIGMVFQKPNPFPTLSVFENVAAGPRLYGITGAPLASRVRKALEDVGLWEEVASRLDEPGNGLSGGQQQRLCIARAIAVEPEVILMDEPCSALDPISTLTIEELIEELKARYTIVLVTHNMEQAGRVADTTAFVLDGELIEYGRTSQIFTTPQDDRTNAYVTGKFS